jgi:zinc carboxypeptidase/carboxypeptidase M14-like protein
MMLFFLAALVSIQANFEGGNIGKIETLAPDHFRCHVTGQTDQDGRNRQGNWYYFRVDHAVNHTITFDLVDLAGEYNYQPNRGAITKDTLPFYTSDQVHWYPVEEAAYDASVPSLQFKIKAPADTFWVAHVPAYTAKNLATSLRDVSKSGDVEESTAGKSVEGRPIPLLTITDPSVPHDGKKVIWLMFRQHAWEAGSSWTGDGLIRFVTSSSPVAARIRRDTVLKIFPLCDPDGVADGGVRFNRNGYDLNRNWDLVDPVKMPEIAAERGAILDWVDSGKRIDFFLTLHNTETNEYLNTGPDPTPSQRALLQRVFDLWSAGGTFLAAQPPASMATSTTPGKPGRMSVVQGLYHDRHIPGFEVEMRIVKHPKLGRRPNVKDRQRAGEELIQAIWKGLEEK